MLDWHLPKMSGEAFLSEVRQNPVLESSIVFVMTSSNSDVDKDTAYKYHVAGFTNKGNFFKRSYSNFEDN